MITKREKLPEPDPERSRSESPPAQPAPSPAPDLVPRRVAEREATRKLAAAPPVNAPSAAPQGEAVVAQAERPLSVAEVVSKVRDQLHAAFRFPVLVQGEASNVRRPRGGNIYFTLKDRRAQLRVVLFANTLEKSSTELAEGAQVVVKGQITAYLDQGELQLIAETVEPVGLGEKAKKHEQTKQRLRALGLFDPKRKRPLPLLPRVIGLVTSPTGAAIRDVLSTIERRCPSVRVVISPVRTTGEAAAPEIALALGLLDRNVACDVIVVARGGGKREELEAFDDERVVRAIAASRAPVVTGIGHETDVSLADLAADVRAPTPTAAAELAVPDLASIEQDLSEREQRLARALRGRVELASRKLEACARSFGLRAPRELVHRRGVELDSIEQRLQRAAQRSLERARASLGTATAGLESLSPLKVLARGYSLTTRPSGEVVRDAATLAPGDLLETRLARGRVTSRVESVERPREERSP